MILEILCPYCLLYAHLKTELKIEYEPTQNIIDFQCKVCKNFGALKRVPRKAAVFIRIIQAIKKTWSKTKKSILLDKNRSV